jgi:hypothetical protein
MSQDRPCKRCIKRNIGHLCHDESREGHSQHKKSKTDLDATDEPSPKDEFSATASGLPGPALVDDSTPSIMQDDSIGLRPSTSDTMPVSNSSIAPPSAGINGGEQSRPYCAYVFGASAANVQQKATIMTFGLVPRIVSTTCMLFIQTTCSARTRSLTSSIY